jgi:hypothetical protein
MTRKDFEILARWLKNDVVLWSGTETRHDLLMQVVGSLANLLYEQNPRFNHLTFFKACELDYDDVFNLLDFDVKENWDEWQRRRLDFVAKTEI